MPFGKLASGQPDEPGTSMMRLFRLLVPAVTAALLAIAFAPLAKADIFTVRGVPVDASGPSATAARDLAIPTGRAEAFTRLFKRLTPQAEWAKMPAVDEATLDDLITAFEVKNERSSSTRYLADITYTFDPDKVRTLLRGAGVSFTDTRAKPVLVIPVFDGPAGTVLWGSNDFSSAWGQISFRDEVAPMVVPTGDTEDLIAFPDAASVSADWARLEPMAIRYGANEVLIARAVVAGGQATIAWTRVNAKGTSEGSAFGSGGSDGEALASATYNLAIEWQEIWKTRTATDNSAVSTISAIISFASLPEWVETRRRLLEVTGIAGIDVSRITVSEARVTIRYRGPRDLLDEALSEELWMFEADPMEPGYVRLVPYVPEVPAGTITPPIVQ